MAIHFFLACALAVRAPAHTTIASTNTTQIFFMDVPSVKYGATVGESRPGSWRDLPRTRNLVNSDLELLRIANKPEVNPKRTRGLLHEGFYLF
jgi:hypothetical protein